MEIALSKIECEIYTLHQYPFFNVIFQLYLLHLAGKGKKKLNWYITEIIRSIYVN